MNTTETTLVNAATVVIKPVVAGKFNGAFKTFAQNWYNLLNFYGLRKEVSHKIASDCMAALGLAMSKEGSDSLKATVSKANGSGDGGFRIGGKSGLTKYSYAMALVRICQVIESLRLEKLTLKPIKIADLEEFLTEDLTKYVALCDKWAEEQKWITAVEASDAEQSKANKPDDDEDED